jgi:hypothetical protein
MRCALPSGGICSVSITGTHFSLMLRSVACCWGALGRLGRQRHNHRAPARSRVVPDEYCDTLRHISVHVSGIVPADCFRVWAAVRDFGAIDKWYPSAEGSCLQARPRPARLFRGRQRPPHHTCPYTHLWHFFLK